MNPIYNIDDDGNFFPVHDGLDHYFPHERMTNRRRRRSPTPERSHEPYIPIIRNDLPSERKKARDAALSRLERSNKNTEVNFSALAIRERARKEMEKAQKSAIGETSQNKPKIDDVIKNYAVDGVFFACPTISHEILSREEWKKKIKTLLYEKMKTDQGQAACEIIKNCNSLEKSQKCIEAIKKYLTNIISEPEVEKYHQIRMSNSNFSEKVADVEGSREVFQAAGFTEILKNDENYLVWDKNFPIEMLIQLCVNLESCEFFELKLERNLKVLLSSQLKNPNVQLPVDFYRVSLADLKKEQQAKTTALEESLILKTKAMRERERERFANKFKFSLIKIRFPDGLDLQGTFGVYEKLAKVYEFVVASLQHETADFSLISPEGVKFSNDDKEKTLHSLILVPNVILKFVYNETSSELQEYIKEILARCLCCQVLGHSVNNCPLPENVKKFIGFENGFKKVVQLSGVGGSEASIQTDISMNDDKFKEFLSTVQVSHRNDEKVIIPSIFNESHFGDGLSGPDLMEFLSILEHQNERGENIKIPTNLLPTSSRKLTEEIPIIKFMDSDEEVDNFLS